MNPEALKFDWTPIFQVGIVTAIILGANLPFFFMHRSEMRQMEKEMREFREELLRAQLSKRNDCGR